MTDLHKAAQQALEALELAQTDVHWELNSPTRKFLRKAEKNLRAALAGPVEPVPQPGVWMHPWPPVKAQQAEPVAWRCACGANLYIDADGAPRSKAAPAAPPYERPGLSWDGFNISGDAQSVREVRRLVDFHAARRVAAP
jgi:hypothetical protein